MPKSTKTENLVFSRNFAHFFYSKNHQKHSFQNRKINQLAKLEKSVSFKMRPTPSKLVKKFQSYLSICDAFLEKKIAEISSVKVFAISYGHYTHLLSSN